MALVIFGDLFSFPEGNAATNRVYTYAKGFIENGVDTHIICFGNNYLEVHKGITDDIHFYHPYGQKIRNKYFLIRRWYKIKKFYETYKIIKEIHKTDNILAIICYTSLLQTQFFGLILSKLFKSKTILEVSEHPLKDFQESPVQKIQGRLKVFVEPKLSNGIICISRYLIDFYLERKVPAKSLFLVPSTVDPGRFQITNPPSISFKYILYCGSLNINKDGVDILIKSFATISNKFPEINLVLIGKAYDINEEKILKELAINLKLQNRVYFLGQISREKVPDYIQHATILALSRPESMVADAGFPSKLTEYLASGNPIVVTDVGDISLYLKDGQTAFLSLPGNVEAFSDRLEFVLENYTLAKEVGMKGKQLTSSIFNYNFQAKRLLGFINSLEK